MSSPSRGDCFAALAMTYRAVVSDDFAFAALFQGKALVLEAVAG